MTSSYKFICDEVREERERAWARSKVIILLFSHLENMLKDQLFKVIPQYCIAHPYCARFLRH